MRCMVPRLFTMFPLIGDQVSKKGGMIGGFYDFRHSKMKFMNVIRQGTQSISERVHELEGFKMKLQDILKLFSNTLHYKF